MTMQQTHEHAEEPPVREVDPAVFSALGNAEAAFVIVNTKDGKEEILVPEGSEWERSPPPDYEVTALLSISATSCYTKCRDGKKYRCCYNVCVRVGDC